MKKFHVILFSLLYTSISLTGCISNSASSIGDCGEGYSEMYGGYDYTYATKQINSDNSLNVTVQLTNGGSGWLEESEQHESNQEIFVTLSVKFSDGSESSIGYQSTSWDINGDRHDGTYWAEFLYYQSPNGVCDSGCQEIMLSAGYENGMIYFDGTCEESPWIMI